MRLAIAALLCCLPALTACTATPRHDPNTISPTTTERPVEGRPTFGEPIAISGHTTVLVPFSIETDKGLFQDSDPYTRGGLRLQGTYASGYPTWVIRAGSNVRWHNAVFRDLATEEAWPVLEGRGIIAEYHVFHHPRVEAQDPPSTRALVFIAVVEDSNRDRVLNDLDARVAILTDGDGRNPRVVTPRDAQVWAVQYNPQTDMLLFQIATDTTGDGRFTFDDVAMPYALAADARAVARPVLSESTRRAVEAMLTASPPLRERPEAAAATP